MTYAESIANWRARNEKMGSRMRVATQAVDMDTLNRQPAPGVWSPAQVVAHLVLTNGLYLPRMKSALDAAERNANPPAIRFTFFGKRLAAAAGPQGNVPSPRVLRPRAATLPREILEEWQQQQEQLTTLLQQAAGVDISQAPVRNPLIPLIRMNVADCFEILTGHTERHVGQIEERLQQMAKQPSSV